MEELITICVPVYNGEKRIASALKSMLSQSYKNIRIIVCDNASTDNTRKIVESIQDPRLQYKYYEEHLDVNYSFLRSLRSAEDGEIVCLFHSDDWYYPDIVETEYKYIQQDNVGAVFSKMNYVDEDHRTAINNDRNGIVEKYNYSSYINKAITRGTIFQCPTFMTRVSVLKETGLWNADHYMISDLSFWLPIIRRFDIVDIQDTLMNYQQAKTQLSQVIYNRRRMIVTPQFILFDKEIRDIKTNNLFTINKSAYLKYKGRRAKELLSIYRNLKKMGKPNRIYLEMLLKNKDITLERIARNEKEYLNQLYGR